MPVIDRDAGWTFVHVPKTGGQSIMKALGRGKDASIGHHAALYEVPGHEKMFTFGFVRNPWDRMASLYTFMCEKARRPSDHFDQNELRRIGFKKWLLDWDFDRAAYQNRHVRQFRMRQPQLVWLDGCSFVGRFESLQADFDLICDAIRLGRRKLPHVNGVERAHYSEFYDCETAAAVTKWFLPDIEVFGYEFERGPEQQEVAA